MNMFPTFVYTKRDTKRNNRGEKRILSHKCIYDINLETDNIYFIKFNCKCEEGMDIGIDIVGYTKDRKDYKVATSVRVEPSEYSYDFQIKIPRSDNIEYMSKMPFFSNKYFEILDLNIIKLDNKKIKKTILPEKKEADITSDLNKIGWNLRKVVCDDKNIEVFDVEHNEIFLK